MKYEYFYNVEYIRRASSHKGKRDKVGINLGIPIIVLDTKTKELFEYSSINEAARSFNAYPKTIWRKVYSDKLYLDRYRIIIKDNNKVSNYLSNKLKYGIGIVRDNSKLIYCLIILAIIGLILYIVVSYIMLIYKDIYNDYISNISRIKGDYLRNRLEYRLRLYNNVKEPVFTNIIFCKNKLISFDWKWNTLDIPRVCKEDLFVNNNKLGIYQSIINSINLNFHNVDAISIIDTFSPISKMHSSPIMERVDLNSAFSTLTTNVVHRSMNNNPLGIEGISNISIARDNRSSLILDTSIVLNLNKPKTTELLNYQSNILYLMINGLSPSLY